MKIAVLTSEYVTEANWHGGLANYLHRISMGLNARGHTVHVFVYSDRQEIFDYNGVKIHRIGFNDINLQLFNVLTFRLFRGASLMLYIAYKFKKYFIPVNQTERYDIIHSASCQTPALFLKPEKIGVPIITRMSSVMKQCQIVYKRKNILDMNLVNLLEKRLVKNSTRVFSPSRLVQKIIKREFRRHIDLLESPDYFPSPGDDDASIYNEYLKDKKYILFYGTLGRLKGSEFITEIIGDFLNEFPEFYFVIIGKMEILRKGVLPIEPILRNAGSNRHRIIYCNSLKHRRLFPVIKHSLAVLLPSMIDNLPNTCIETMNLGKVVIGTYEGGFDQIIENDKNGYLIKYGDKQSLLSVLRKICRANEGELSIIGNNAKNTINKRLNFEEKIIELENYYQNAIAEFNKIHENIR
jgi:glycosyltransferase involved in cell wall biosynthesis